MTPYKLDLKDGKIFGKSIPVLETKGEFGIPLFSDPGFLLAVNMGMVPGFSVVDKFGFNPIIAIDSDPETIWEGGNIYTYSTTADIVSLVSTSINDTQDVFIEGLDTEGNKVNQIITLSGTTRVPLNTPLWRVDRMYNNGITGFEGIIKCYVGTEETPTTSADVRAIINNGNNQTLMALYTIPKGKVGFLFRGEVGMQYSAGSASQNVEYASLVYKSRLYGKVFRIKKLISLISSGNSNYQDVRSFPDIIPQLTDIEIYVQEVSNTMGVWSAFDILVVDSDRLPDSLLKSIGQL